jgi:hypothetical protein
MSLLDLIDKIKEFFRNLFGEKEQEPIITPPVDAETDTSETDDNTGGEGTVEEHPDFDDWMSKYLEQREAHEHRLQEWIEKHREHKDAAEQRFKEWYDKHEERMTTKMERFRMWIDSGWSKWEHDHKDED